ncbi:MAG: tetratricopeptide repeat protein [Flavobacteriales bacterium]
MITPTHIKRFALLSFLLISSVAWSQSKKDSLLAVVKTNGFNDSTCNALIWTYVFNQPDSAIYYGKRGLEWAKTHRSEQFVGTMFNRIGVAYDIKSRPDSALHWYNLALEQARKRQNRKTEGGALNNIGLIYWNLGEPEKAIDHYIRSAEIFEEIGNEIGLGNTYNNIALILHEDDQDEKSLDYHRKALQVRLRINHTYGIAASYSNIAQIYLYVNEPLPDSAKHYLELAIPLKQQLNDQYGLARAYHSLADVYVTSKEFGLALESFQKTLRIQKQIGNSEGYASTYYNLADVYQEMGEVKTQLVYLDSAEMVAYEHQDRPLLWKVYWEKARALGRIGEFETAHPYWVRYQQLKDSLDRVEKSAKVEELETRFRTAEQERELSEKKVALAEAQVKVANKDKWIFGLTGGLLSILLFAFAMRQITRRNAQAEKDAAIITERERGLAAIISATEEERKRIAKDLHDGIVQTLTGLSLRLQKGFSMIKDVSEEQKTRYTESKRMLDDSIAEIRNISHEMMPRALSEMGLIPAMEDMLGKSLGSTEIKYEFEHHKMEGERFPENVEVSLYRISQELVNNIIKHSQAKAVSVQLLRTKTHLVLVVEDNGKGFKFDSNANQNGIGLMNISSRAKAINGEVNYQPSPEQGTVATIRIPLP